MKFDRAQRVFVNKIIRLVAVLIRHVIVEKHGMRRPSATKLHQQSQVIELPYASIVRAMP
jgi:hypothetical protein